MGGTDGLACWLWRKWFSIWFKTYYIFRWVRRAVRYYQASIVPSSTPPRACLRYDGGSVLPHVILSQGSPPPNIMVGLRKSDYQQPIFDPCLFRIGGGLQINSLTKISNLLENKSKHNYFRTMMLEGRITVTLSTLFRYTFKWSFLAESSTSQHYLLLHFHYERQLRFSVMFTSNTAVNNWDVLYPRLHVH